MSKEEDYKKSKWGRREDYASMYVDKTKLMKETTDMEIDNYIKQVKREEQKRKSVHKPKTCDKVETIDGPICYSDALKIEMRNRIERSDDRDFRNQFHLSKVYNTARNIYYNYFIFKKYIKKTKQRIFNPFVVIKNYIKGYFKDFTRWLKTSH